MVLRLLMQLLAMAGIGSSAAVWFSLYVNAPMAPWAAELVGSDTAAVQQVATWVFFGSIFLYIVTCFRAPFEDRGEEA